MKFMKYLFGIIVLILIVIAIANLEKQEGQWYDCRLAEISPDFPTEVKQECRRINYEHWKKEQNERQI